MTSSKLMNGACIALLARSATSPLHRAAFAESRADGRPESRNNSVGSPRLIGGGGGGCFIGRVLVGFEVSSYVDPLGEGVVFKEGELDQFITLFDFVANAHTDAYPFGVRYYAAFQLARIELGTSVPWFSFRM